MINNHKSIKAGIMSMQRIPNYGSYLQSWSLKQILEELGCDVVFVDYEPKPCIEPNMTLKKKAADFLRWLRVYKLYNLKLAVKNVLGALGFKNIHKYPTDNIFKQPLSDMGITDFKRYRQKTDVLVIGSDEVFNCLQKNPDVGFSMELFGANSRAKRVISYAASFGNTTLKRIYEYGVADKLKKALSGFYRLSVRDENSEKIVKELCGIKPYCHLDPVLIGDFSSFKHCETLPERYMIVYGYKNRFDDIEQAYIKEFALKNSLKTVAIGGRQDFCDVYVQCSPYDIVSFFKDAEYVVTDTFHGTIFSIIAHTPFVTRIRTSEDNSYGNAEKLNDLLRRMEFEDRRISDFRDLGNIITTPISFERSDLIRENGRRDAIEYLSENILQ